ncbi:MAG: hypothetical protein ACOC2N_08515 [Spirochaetota bacterium]
MRLVLDHQDEYESQWAAVIDTRYSMREVIGRMCVSDQSLCQWLKSDIGIVVTHGEDENRMKDHIVPPDGLAHVAR